MPKEGASSISRSVDRVIAIMEHFEIERRPLTSAELCECLESPRSSVAALVQVLVDRKILSHDRRAKTYFPTARLARIGSWHTSEVLVSARLKQKLRAMKERLGETVVISMPLDLALEVIHFEQGPRPITLQVQPGGMFSLWGTAVGSAYLSTLPLPTIKSMLARAEKSEDGVAPPAGFELAAVLNPVKEQGYAVVRGGVDTSLTAVAMPMKHRPLGKQLIISAGGPTDRFEKSLPEVIATLREMVNIDYWS